MKTTSHIFNICVAVALTATACGSCDGADEDPIDLGNRGSDARYDMTSTARDQGGLLPDTGSDAGFDLAGLDADNDAGTGSTNGDTGREPDGGSEDGGADADAASPDAVCGDGVIDPPEACDDANAVDGDYCSADCALLTGSCGDGVLQSNESCDDGAATDCASTHDGGDGACVAQGSCSAGYSPDAGGVCVPTNTTGLSEPCSNGLGWTMFRFHYSNNSTSAQIDVWDASCSYSFASGSACNVREVYPGFGSVSRTSDGYPIFTSSNYLRVRFSAAGLNFSNATLWIQARSYATGASTYYDVWSPLYGSREGGPVDNDFVYDWYGLDWTGHLYPTDDPALTAIQLYGGRGSGSLAVRAVELCVN